MLSQKTILIIGGKSPVALELVRSFKFHKATVLVADFNWSSLSRWSNHTDKYFRVAPPAQKFQSFKHRIQDIVNKENVTDCIPTYEDSFYLSQIRNDLNCNVWVSEIELLNNLHRKDKFIEISKDFFHVPETTKLTSFLGSTRNYVFKPIYSRFANRILIKPSYEVLQQISNKSEWIAQEFIEGKEFCVYSIWDQGKCKAVSIYHPLIRMGVGAGIYYLPVQHQELLNQVKAFGEHLNYHGQLSFDFIQGDDKLYVIECNPRTTSGAHLLNRNLASAFFQKDVLETGDGIAKTLKFPLLLLKPWMLFRNLFYEAEDSIFSWKDPLPFFMQGFSLIEFYILAIRKGISFQQATTYNIEWNGEPN